MRPQRRRITELGCQLRNSTTAHCEHEVINLFSWKAIFSKLRGTAYVFLGKLSTWRPVLKRTESRQGREINPRWAGRVRYKNKWKDRSQRRKTAWDWRVAKMWYDHIDWKRKSSWSAPSQPSSWEFSPRVSLVPKTLKFFSRISTNSLYSIDHWS